MEEEIGKGARQDPDAITFVDIGGGMGHEALALKNRYPNLPGRFVNQDLPQIVSGQNLDGVESMAHDFFSPQPLRGKHRVKPATRSVITATFNRTIGALQASR